VYFNYIVFDYRKNCTVQLCTDYLLCKIKSYIADVPS